MKILKSEIYQCLELSNKGCVTYLVHGKDEQNTDVIVKGEFPIITNDRGPPHNKGKDQPHY